MTRLVHRGISVLVKTVSRGLSSHFTLGETRHKEGGGYMEGETNMKRFSRDNKQKSKDDGSSHHLYLMAGAFIQNYITTL